MSFAQNQLLNEIFMFLCLALALCEILAREFQNKKYTPKIKQKLKRTKLFKLQSRSQSTTASNTDRILHLQKYHFSSPDLDKKGNICFCLRIRYKRPPKFLFSRKTKLLQAIPLRPAPIHFPRRLPLQFLQI